MLDHCPDSKAKMMRIDSHHHFWDYSAEQYEWINDEMSVLRRDFGPRDLAAAAGPKGIEKVVSVQARQTVEESDWLLSIADGSDLVAAVVGWVPLASGSVREEVERLSHADKFRAVRHVVQGEPDDDFILGKQFNAGVAILKEYGLVYDVLIFAKHLENTIKFVDQHPQQPFVLDHIAKPTIRGEQFDAAWAKHMKELAKRPNVTCKFSGVATEVRDPTWDIATVQPYWDVALEAFGPKRLMFGSDWPVCLLRTEYARWVECVEELASPLSEAEKDHFWRQTANEAYGLKL
ncbi:MAG: amidohydrolase family protein [Aureliella sp.]